jgi:hypothetical protein
LLDWQRHEQNKLSLNSNHNELDAKYNQDTDGDRTTMMMRNQTAHCRSFALGTNSTHGHIDIRNLIIGKACRRQMERRIFWGRTLNRSALELKAAVLYAKSHATI